MLFSNNSKMNRCAQGIPIVFVTLLIAALGLAFGYIFNTKLFQDNLGGVAVTFSILFYINYILIYWNYFMAICTDPGKIKKEWSDHHLLEVKFLSDRDKERFIEYHSETIPNIAEQLENPDRPQVYKYCHRCNVVKPHRAHHCSQCKRCHLKMDHHCPWIGGCVGTYNHKFFVMFLFHAAFGTFFETIAILPFLTEKDLLQINSMDSVYILLTFIFCIALTLALNVLMFFQIGLICKNSTTIEENIYSKKVCNPAFQNQRPSPFKMRKMCDNYKQVFGEWKCAWFCPLKPKYGYVDGHEYPYDEQLLRKDLEFISERDKMHREDGAIPSSNNGASSEQNMQEHPYQPPELNEEGYQEPPRKTKYEQINEQEGVKFVFSDHPSE